MKWFESLGAAIPRCAGCHAAVHLTRKQGKVTPEMTELYGETIERRSYSKNGDGIWKKNMMKKN